MQSDINQLLTAAAAKPREVPVGRILQRADRARRVKAIFAIGMIILGLTGGSVLTISLMDSPKVSKPQPVAGDKSSPTPAGRHETHGLRLGGHLGKLRSATRYSDVKDLASRLARTGLPCSRLKVSTSTSGARIVATSANCFLDGAEVGLSVGPIPHPFVSFGTRPSWFAIGPNWEVSTGEHKRLAYRVHRLLKGQLWYR
jgi:hypothetical protein